MNPYSDIPALQEIYLEDSFVVKIEASEGELSFALEAVLTPKHPRYHEPRPGERYCYIDAVLTFRKVADLRWLERTDSVSSDADGDEDLGNIDVLQWEGDLYDIAGDWGHVRVRSAAIPEVRYPESGRVDG